MRFTASRFGCGGEPCDLTLPASLRLSASVCVFSASFKYPLIFSTAAEQDRLRKDLVATWQTLTQREAFLQDLLQKEQAERDKVEQKNFILLQVHCA